MRDHVFHLAIPVGDLDDARHFYVTQLGCKLARTYPDRITLDFFGDQVVCHLTEPPEHIDEPQAYPRHFGVTFRHVEDFRALFDLAVQRKLEFFRDLSVRFEGLVEVHETFMLVDPSRNVLEFKHYRDARMMY